MLQPHFALENQGISKNISLNAHPHEILISYGHSQTSLGPPPRAYLAPEVGFPWKQRNHDWKSENPTPRVGQESSYLEQWG